MVYLPVEDLLSKSAHSSYKLVTMASRRALEIANGSPKLVEAPANEKSATTALREIMAGKVMTKEAADIMEAEAKSKKSK
ncbi:MAG: DNA-directed RNA polymerase subunit omega [Candidatus Omnitrophica bacterium]|nr:DNA-directed RNA polymerase subunit omega [Candidatus Omnitrophota bacterium]